MTLTDDLERFKGFLGARPAPELDFEDPESIEAHYDLWGELAGEFGVTMPDKIEVGEFLLADFDAILAVSVAGSCCTRHGVLHAANTVFFIAYACGYMARRREERGE